MPRKGRIHKVGKRAEKRRGLRQADWLEKTRREIETYQSDRQLKELPDDLKHKELQDQQWQEDEEWYEVTVSHDGDDRSISCEDYDKL